MWSFKDVSIRFVVSVGLWLVLLEPARGRSGGAGRSAAARARAANTKLGWSLRDRNRASRLSRVPSGVPSSVGASEATSELTLESSA